MGRLTRDFWCVTCKAMRLHECDETGGDCLTCGVGDSYESLQTSPPDYSREDGDYSDEDRRRDHYSRMQDFAAEMRGRG